MAYTATPVAQGGSFIYSLFSGIGRGIEMLAESNRRVHEVERLNAMSDSQLQEIGLRREDIARTVFKDVFCL